LGAVAIGARAVVGGAGASRGGDRYLGYGPDDERRPYAKYMKQRVDPPQPHVSEAIAAGALPSDRVPPRRALATELHDPGYAPVETGFGRTQEGEIWVACLTDMPRVTPAMWDWWFAWHSHDSARYKLWHPEAHAYAALRRDRRRDPSLTDRQRYRGNTSYVDEQIGGRLDQLAISFQDPARYGIDERRFDGTAICGSVGTALLPVDVGILVHQVRPTARGAEMRSRFYLNVPRPRRVDLAGIASAVRRGVVVPQSIGFDLRFGAALLRHCGEEMNHLAQFLPELHAEFGGSPT
ncbi:MAG: hypothetical protein WC558_15005, partial [Patulibacter sp.]